MATSPPVISYTTSGKFAILTLNKPGRLNALTLPEFHDFARTLDEINQLNDVVVTVVTGTGRFFCAGADINKKSSSQPGDDIRQHYLQDLVAANFYLTRALSTHSKILVVALNGPAVGGGAAIVAFGDFVYADPQAYLLFPFASLGLVTEAGTSRTVVQKLGISLANEALLTGRRIQAEELLKCGFVNKIIHPTPPTPNDGDMMSLLSLGIDPPPNDKNKVSFLSSVMKELDEWLGDHLNPSSLLGIKDLIQRPEREIIEAQNVREIFAGVDRLASGVVDREMAKILSGQKRHKL